MCQKNILNSFIYSLILMGLLFEIAQSGIVLDSVKQITAEPLYQNNPTWSPDGGKIAYVQDPYVGAGMGDIWVMNADGSNKYAVVTHPAWDEMPSWAHDSCKIAFVSNRSVWPGDVWIKDLCTGAEYRLTCKGTQNYVAGPSSWSPDDSLLIFWTNRNSGKIDYDADLYTIRTTCGCECDTQFVVSNIDGHIAWSPCGDKIAFGRDNDLWLVNPDGTGETLVDTNGFSPSWSPDCSMIAFFRNEDIWVMNKDGTCQTQLTTDPAGDVVPAWSPDGDKIAFQSVRSDISGDIWVLYVTTFTRGDCSGDGKVSITDVICLINYLFKGGPAPSPIQSGDVNSDGDVTVSDVIYLINYLFKGGLPPSC